VKIQAGQEPERGDFLALGAHIGRLDKARGALGRITAASRIPIGDRAPRQV